MFSEKVTVHDFAAAHHPGHRGVIPAMQGEVISALGVNDGGVTHAGESFMPLTGRSLDYFDVNKLNFVYVIPIRVSSTG